MLNADRVSCFCCLMLNSVQRINGLTFQHIYVGDIKAFKMIMLSAESSKGDFQHLYNKQTNQNLLFSSRWQSWKC